MNKTGALCPQCGGNLVERKTKQKKRIFYGCSNYPTCNFAIWERPVPDLCPNCGGLMVVPRTGQDPICYTEVVAVQRNNEEKPQQDANAPSRTSRKKTPKSETSEPLTAEPTTSRKMSNRTAAGKKKTTRAPTTKKTTAAKSKNATTRAKTAKAR